MDDITKTNLNKSILNLIKTRVGLDNAISSKQITGFLQSRGFKNVPDLQRVARDIIRELRRDGNPICSKSGTGYFWPESLDDIIATVENLNHVANDLHYTAKLIKESGERLFGLQQKLF